jgi:folate-binding protein YgfZ
MTDLLQTTEIPITALADSLAAAGSSSPIALVPYLGTLTPRKLDAPEVETGALLFGAAVHDLGWLRRIAVRGEDRFRWLSGMVTNAVETMPDYTDFGSGAYSLVLNAQGRIQADCYVWRDGDNLEIHVAADQFDALMSHLDRFIIMDDVELVPLEGFSALGISGPGATAILRTLGLPVPPQELSSVHGSVSGIPLRIDSSYGTLVPHLALWTEAEYTPALWQALTATGAIAVGADALETLRIVEGIPAYGIDIQSRDLVQETAQMRAVSFTKGCYLGQEIVERIRSRGQVHRHLRSLELTLDEPASLPPQGTELFPENAPPDAKPAATLTSVASLRLDGSSRIFAIGMIRAEAEVGNHPLRFPGGTARILTAPPKLNHN